MTVCDFLTEQFEDFNKSYSTINSYRSTLSSMLLPVDGYSVGEHPIIARLLKVRLIPKYFFRANKSLHDRASKGYGSLT